MEQAVPKKYLLRGAFVAILLFALFLRLWRLDFGMELPYQGHPDEPTQFDPAISIIQTGDWNPHFFNYPSLTIYLNTLILQIGFWIGRAAGLFESLADLQQIRTVKMGVGLVGTPEMLLLGRGVTAVMGTLTAGLTFALAKHLAKLKYTPILAALGLAISQEHIRLSHYMTVDVIATFFAIATVTACTIALSKNDKRFLWIAAICGGLASSSKYNYALLSIPAGLTCLLYPSPWIDKSKRLVLNGILFCLAFALTSPYVLLDYANAKEGILSEISHYSTGHLGVTGNSFTWYLTYLWRINPLYLILGIPGIILCIWYKKRTAVPMVIFGIIYFGLIGIQIVHFDRNALPMMVLLIVGLSMTVDTLLQWALSRARVQTLNKLVVSPVVIAVTLLPLLPSLLALPTFLETPKPSGRALAQDWFDKVLETEYGQERLRKKQSGTLEIVAEAYTVFLDPKVYAVKYKTGITDGSKGTITPSTTEYDIIILGSGMFNRFYEHPELYPKKVRAYDAFFDSAPTLEAIAFEGDDDPVAFIPGGSYIPDGTDVYVFFVTDEAKQFKAEMEDILSRQD